MFLQFVCRFACNSTLIKKQRSFVDLICPNTPPIASLDNFNGLQIEWNCTSGSWRRAIIIIGWLSGLLSFTVNLHFPLIEATLTGETRAYCQQHRHPLRRYRRTSERVERVSLNVSTRFNLWARIFLRYLILSQFSNFYLFFLSILEQHFRFNE